MSENVNSVVYTHYLNIAFMLWRWRSWIGRDRWYFDAGFFANLLNRWLHLGFRELKFRCLDIRTEDGILYRLKLAFPDMFLMEQDILLEFPKLPEVPGSERLRSFLLKQLLDPSPEKRRGAIRGMFLVQVVRWHQRTYYGINLEKSDARL